MGTIIRGTYQGTKQTKLEHSGNGSSIVTDAPKDNNGLGRNFSPTDMVAGALGSCMMTVIAIYAERHDIALEGMWSSAEKIMAENPRRIASIPIEIHLPATILEKDRATLERVALTCPVHNSLHPDIKSDVRFVYDV